MIRGSIILLLLFSISVGYAAAASGQLQNLTEVGTFTTDDPHDAEIFKDFMYIADGNSLLVYNISDPERPKLITKFTDFNEPRRVVGLSISEDRLYTAAGAGWIYVLNITNPEKPEKLYQLNYLDSSNDVALDEKYMYVADANTGLLIFDLNDRRNPELAGMFYILKSNVSGSLQGWGGISVEVSGDYALLSGAYNKGFYIIDISNKTVPKEMFHSLGKNVYDIAVSGTDIYLARADGTSEFDLLNLSDIYAPEITGNFSIPGTADRSAIAVFGEYIYAASDETWHIFRMQDTLPPQILIKAPNQDEIITNQTIEVSGSAFDSSGIAQVLVNGNFAGTELWRQTISLVQGINNINITATDKKSNYKTEILQISYQIPEKPVEPTPKINFNVTETERIDTMEKPVFLNLIYVAFIFIILIAIIYQVLKSKIRK